MHFPRSSKLLAVALIGLSLALYQFPNIKAITNQWINQARFRDSSTPLTGQQANLTWNSPSRNSASKLVRSSANLARPTATPSIPSPTPVQPVVHTIFERGSVGTAAGAATVQAPEPTAAPPEVSPAFQQFIDTMADGNPNEVRGVYIENVLSLPIVQQPDDDPVFVSTQLGTVTQFRSAANYGVTGLLAHNYLSGELFFNLAIGNEVRIVFGDGSYHRYLVSGTYSFQKMNPSSLQSDFTELATGDHLTSGQVFARFYSNGDKVTFQTCIERDGVSNWGLLFVVADPILQ